MRKILYVIRAGYSKRTAKQKACNLLREPAVAEAIGKALMERTDLTRTFIVDELAKVARANAGDYFEWCPDGVTIRASSELSEEQKAAVSEVSGTKTEVGSSTARLKLYDKVTALERLGRVLGLFNEAPTVAAAISFSWAGAEPL